MIRRLEIPNGWYGEARVDGAYAVLVTNSHIQTSTGDVPLPTYNVLFVRIPPQGPLKIAGQNHGGNDNLEWDGTEWHSVGGSYGVSPVIYDWNGVLHQNIVEYGSQGLRYVTYDNTLVTGDQTYVSPALGLYEFTTYGDISIGQGGNGGAIAVRGSERRVIEPGDTRFIRYTRIGDQLAVSIWKAAEAKNVLLWFDASDLASFPLEVVPPQPEPPDPPTPEPPDPIPVPPKPVPPTPQEPPVPPLKTTERYWLHPNIDSDVPAACHGDLATVDVFGLYVQWILEDARYGQIDTLSGIRAQGVNLGIEMGSIKPGDWHADKAISDLPRVAERVLAKGHRVCYLTMDEPLTSAKLAPWQPFSESVFAVAKFVEAARKAMPGVKVILAEACPEIDLETQRQLLMGLDSWGCHLDGWHLDMDWKRARSEGLDPYGIIKLAKVYADDYKVPLGVFLVGYSHMEDRDYYNEVIQLATDLHREASWCIDHVLVQAWAERAQEPQHGPQNLPSNFGEFGLFPLFGHVQEDIFQ